MKRTAEYEGLVIEQLVMSSCTHGVLNYPVGSPGMKVFIDRFKAQAVQSQDPVEALILEQLLLVHFRLGRLHQESAQAAGTESIKVLNSASARLSGEFRRLVLALRTYRSPASGKAVNFIRQQNVASKQNVHLNQKPPRIKQSFAKRSKLEGNKPSMPFGGRFVGAEEPASRGSRSDKRQKAAIVDA